MPTLHSESCIVNHNFHRKTHLTFSPYKPRPIEDGEGTRFFQSGDPFYGDLENKIRVPTLKETGTKTGAMMENG